MVVGFPASFRFARVAGGWLLLVAAGCSSSGGGERPADGEVDSGGGAGDGAMRIDARDARGVIDGGTASDAPAGDVGGDRGATSAGDASAAEEGGGDSADVAAAPCWEHEVAEGETLWDIAVAYRVTVEAIMEANRLRLRHVRMLSKGRRLCIPGATGPAPVLSAAQRAEARRLAIEALPPLEDGAYHVVGDGETLWAIARLYDKTVDEIAARNGFTDDDLRSLAVGRAVIVPGITADQVKRAESGPRSGVTHTLASGETVWDLARAFGVAVSQIMAANRLSAADVRTLREGTRLFVPGVTEDRAGRVRRVASANARERSAGALARRLGLGTAQIARDLLRGVVRRSWIEAAGGSGALPGTLRWPVTNGWYVRGWGSGEGGYHLAVDIMGEIGWNVRAAAPGIVAYSGNELRGFGNIVIVIHPGGWVTLYAHNSVNFAVAGERVAAGAILAELGSTGISRGPHVHFEFIFRGENCDPDLLFRPGVRHRNGRIQPMRYLEWPDPDDRPSRIRCAPRRSHPHSRYVEQEAYDENASAESASDPQQ